mgnify:CR=1 FL=1
MFLKPDYDLKNIFEIDLESLKSQGITKKPQKRLPARIPHLRVTMSLTARYHC